MGASMERKTHLLRTLILLINIPQIVWCSTPARRVSPPTLNEFDLAIS